jgi:hypothetical protein
MAEIQPHADQVAAAFRLGKVLIRGTAVQNDVAADTGADEVRVVIDRHIMQECEPGALSPLALTATPPSLRAYPFSLRDERSAAVRVPIISTMRGC